ncbi:MAG: diguanylate cyclase [Burkholderiales bacterium]|nr:diguanylate cyclase [Burkholderiales bacterium]
MKLPLHLGIPQRRSRLLVVDDQPANVQTLYQALAADHQIFVATHGEQALKLVREKQPDLVLLDVVMPGMDGFEVCRRLKADPGTVDLPVIFVTAHSDDNEETRGLNAGAVDFITKPINPAVVRARVKTHLTLKHQSDLLRQMAFVDGLTGVFNRRYFDDRLQQEWLRAVRHGSPLSVVLIDIDHFKHFNDTYGHQAGDDCLRRVAQVLAAGLNRPGDLLARYGGEEFACILPETDAAGALELARRMGLLVKDLGIEHSGSPSHQVLTISLGVAGRDALPPGEAGGSAAELLASADRQLYRAKHLGRDQACVV